LKALQTTIEVAQERSALYRHRMTEAFGGGVLDISIGKFCLLLRGIDVRSVDQSHRDPGHTSQLSGFNRRSY
jgi:hypothetical protein